MQKTHFMSAFSICKIIVNEKWFPYLSLWILFIWHDIVLHLSSFVVAL